MKGKMTRMIMLTLGLLVALAFSLTIAQGQAPEGSAAPQAAIGTAFTYQGRLTDNGDPANGTYDFRFILYDALLGGRQAGSVVTVDDVSVVEGLFTVTLDFGPVFDGTALWLETAVREGSSTGAYTILSPRQALTAAPYALGLRAGAIISGTVSGPALTVYSAGDGLFVYDAGGASNHFTGDGAVGFEVAGAAGAGLYVGRADQDGIHIKETGYEGVDVENAGRDGFEVDNAGLDGLHVGTVGSDGVHVENAASAGLRVADAGNDGVRIINAGLDGLRVVDAADDGVHVSSAGQDGVLVAGAGHHGIHVGTVISDGLHVEHSDGDGISVCSTGSETSCDQWSYNNGLEVGSAEDYGVFVNSAGLNGVSVRSAGLSGVYVTYAGSDGLSVWSAGTDGVDVYGADLAGNFRGDIQVSGSCSGCLMATFGVNTGEQPLEPGSVVTIQGAQPSGLDGVPMLWQVTQAGAGQPVVGVVEGRAELRTEEEPRPGEIGQQLIPREGVAEPGAFVTIIIYGPVQVQAGNAAGAITPGAKLAIGEQGRARALQTVAVDGVQLAESAPVIGIALSAPDADGRVWVLVNPQ